jgi:hypothetical protein
MADSRIDEWIRQINQEVEQEIQGGHEKDNSLDHWEIPLANGCD